ncbi:MAG: iron uptake porin [Cyanobacteriota bacterium]|nr:iron uptake porin [Cyanobacteriota bacterium]
MAQVPENVSPADTPEKVIPVDQLSNFDFEAEIPTSGLDKYNDPLGQVTSVSQLSDVSPTDWAFQALQSLIERYGCISGYPDGTFRGNRAMTRYEFAAGVNQCLDRITELIAAATADVVTRDDLAVLERLQEEFAVELAEIENRVDLLETRTATLESQQFSTTTKLGGQVVTYLADAFGEDAGDENNTVFQYRTRLTFTTSFTGSDRLTVRMQAGNMTKFSTASEFPEGRLGGDTDEAVLLFGGGGGKISAGSISYRFPLSDELLAIFSVSSDDRIISDLVSPASGVGIGAVSNYGRLNPMLFPIFLEAGVGLRWDVAPWLNLDFFAGSESGSASDPDRGFFGDGYGISTRATMNFDALNIALIYVHGYSPENGINTSSGSNASKVIGAGPVHGDTFLGAVFYRFSPKLVIGASGAFSNARTLGKGTEGNAHVIDYRLNVYFPDLFREGNFAGLIAGIQPKLVHTSNDDLARAIGLPEGLDSDRDTGWHLEAFYTFRVNDNITITPGVLWLTAPNHDERNSDVVVGAVRTTFSF